MSEACEATNTPEARAPPFIMTEATETTQKETSAADALKWVQRVFRKHWPLLIASIVLSTAVGLFYGKSQPKVYDAATLIEFDPDVIKPLGNKADPMVGWSAIWDTQSYYETQYRIMISDRVLGAVVRDLGLQTDQAFWGFKPQAPVPMDESIGALRGRLNIDPVKGSRLVYIRIEDTSPAQARRLADAVARTYIAQNLETTVSATSDTLVWLSGQLDHFKGDLETTENDLHEFKKRNDLPSSSLEEVSKQVREEMHSYDEALTHTRMRKQELAARESELSKLSPETIDNIPASELLNNGFLSSLRKEYQQATSDRRQLIAEGKGENHPQVKKADERIAQLRQAQFDEIKNLQGAIVRDLAIIQHQEQGELALYEGSRRKAVELNLKELEYHRLDRLRAQNEKLYGVLLEQTKEADLRRMMNTNNIRLVDAAPEPKAPIRPKIPVITGTGALIGLILGLALMFFAEQLDRSLKTPDDVEQRLGVSFLGLLPQAEDAVAAGANKKKGRRSPRRPVTDENARPELIVHARPTSTVAEAARTIRTNVMFMNPDNPHRRLLVTSAAPSEGKTTVACSLAISLAQSGQRVCILDCDLRRPRLHKVFDRVGDAGLTNVLLGDATIDEVVQPTSIENLFSVPSGPVPPNPAEIMHSERFRKFLDELSERVDRIILDSPPVMIVTDAAIASKLVDGVIFVVRAFKTRADMAQQGVKALRDVDASIVGAVLNAVELGKASYGYGYSYYYYRREGYGSTEQAINHDSPEGDSARPN
jgi:capsular exopolysaccharide synthesis family protein